MSDRRPNILYIVAHDLGRHLGCYGRPIASPTLDAFAGRGVIFRRAFCSAPACSPSRACAMTGQYSHTNGLMSLVNPQWELPAERRTIVDCLNDAGYETVHVGLQHERRSAADNRYRIERCRTMDDEWTEAAVGEAIAYLEARRGAARPFYLNVGLREVHASAWQGNGRWCQGRSEQYGRVPLEQVYVPPYMPDRPPIRRELAKFQAAIGFMDAHVRPLLETVERLGHADDTVVVFTTDHGIAGERAKSTLYDAGVEIALLMQLPGGQAAGLAVDHLVQNIDVAPTLLEAAGVDVPPEMQGRSVWPLLTGGPWRPHEEIFLERNYHGPPPGGLDPMRAVRTPRWHYIRNFDPRAKRPWLPSEVPAVAETYDHWYNELWPPATEPRPAAELYDTQADPHELVNLAGRPEHAALEADLAGRLERWMRQTDDPLLRGTIPDSLDAWRATARPPRADRSRP